MASLETRSTPTATGNGQEAQSGALEDSYPAAATTPPLDNAHSSVWRGGRIVWLVCCCFVAVGVLIFGVVGLKMILPRDSIPSIADGESDLPLIRDEPSRELKSANADHESIVLAVAQCNNLRDVKHIQSQKLTSFQRGVIYLSAVISRSRIETAVDMDQHHNRMRRFNILISIVGAITTILISIKSISNGHTMAYFLIGILAIIFSSVGTATSALNSFYNPRESYNREQRSLSRLKQLHIDIAATVNSEVNIDKCISPDERMTKKTIKDWSTRLIAILNASDMAVQDGGKATEGNSPSDTMTTQAQAEISTSSISTPSPAPAVGPGS